MRRRDVHEVVFEVAFALFACAAALAVYTLRRHQPESTMEYIVAMSVPSGAALVLVAVCYLVPNLLAPGRVAYPLNLTLPCVYTALTWVVAILTTTPPSGISRIPEALGPALLWREPGLLLMNLGLGVFMLSSVTLLRRRAR